MKKVLTISTDTIKRIIFYWWDLKGSSLLKQHLSILRQTTGSILRMDHTYKIVKGLGGISDSKNWVNIL